MSDAIYTEVDKARAQKLAPDDRMTNNRLMRWQRQSVSRKLLPHERVAKCYRVRVREFVDVLKSVKHKRAHYGGLSTCGSVWSCPVCTAKITERRRIELQAAIDKAAEMGFHFFMATFTLQHTKADHLEAVRECLTDALRKTKSGRWYKDFEEKFEIVGNVTGSEVTYGAEYGWHFHKHTIFFTRQPVDETRAKQIKESLSLQYGLKLKKSKRYAHPIHGVDVRAADRDVAQYVSKYGQEKNESKWSMAAEMTKPASKSALKNGDHFAAFELLDLYLHGEGKAGPLFQEYAATMKGTRQLRWSSGLRELFKLDAEITDEELAAVQDDDAALFAQLTIAQWRKVLKAEKRGQILEVASHATIEHFQVYLQAL